MSDNESDFTSRPINRALGLLAIPMMLEMGMEAIFAVVDIAFVSRLGTNAIAAVGLTEALITVLYALAIGLGMGVTAMISRRIGAKDPIAAAYVMGQAIWVGAGLSMLIGTFGVIYAGELLSMMGASEGVISEGKDFTAILLGGNASILYLFLLNAGFRGAGDAPVALRSLTLANGLNIILDPCLIFGLGPFPEMGVPGAAVATTIGRSIGVLYLFWYLFGGKGRLQFQLKNLAISPDLIRRMISISIGGIGQFLIATSSWIVIMRVVALFGSAPIAAYTIALRLIEFVFLPAWGLGNAAATLVGQNLGAGFPERAEKSVWQASRYNAVFMTLLGAIFIIMAPTIVGLFTTDAEIHSLRRQLPADPGPRLSDVCRWYDCHSGAQWRGRHKNAFFFELRLFLDCPDSAGILAGDVDRHGTEWCISRDRCFRIAADDTGCHRFPARKMESSTKFNGVN